jgi:regulatory protein
LRERALRMLARREHSRLELRRKLAPHVEENDDIEALLDILEMRGWLSEKRVVEQTVYSRRSRYGAMRIVQELRNKGVSDDAIAEAASKIRESELEAAREVWRKKFSSLPRSAAEHARQMRFMQSRGFDMDVIRKVLRHSDD